MTLAGWRNRLRRARGAPGARACAIIARTDEEAACEVGLAENRCWPGARACGSGRAVGAADVRAVLAQLTTFYWPYAPVVLCLTLFITRSAFSSGTTTAPDRRDRHRLARQRAHLRGGLPARAQPGQTRRADQAVWVRQYTGVPVARAVPVVVAERISDGLAVLLLSTLV